MSYRGENYVPSFGDCDLVIPVGLASVVRSILGSNGIRGSAFNFKKADSHLKVLHFREGIGGGMSWLQSEVGPINKPWIICHKS